MARGEKRKRNAGLGKTTTAGSQLDSGNPLRANSRTLKPAQWLGSEFQGPGVLVVHEQEDRKLVEELLGELPIEQVTRFRALVSDDDSDPDIPVRDLDNFIVFDLKKTSRPNVPPSFLEADDVSINMQGVDPVVMGLVRSTRVQSNGDDESDILDDDLNGDEERMDDMEPIALLSSSLVRVWKDDEDHNIYLQTTYAYYKLGRPHPKYLDTYSPVWIVHRVAHLVCQIMDIDAEEELSSIADIDTLIQVLQSEELVDGQGPSSNIAFEAVRIIGREITETDLHEHCKEIVFLILRMHYHPTVYETRDLDLTHPIFVDLQHLCAAISPNNPLDPPFLEDRIAEWAHHRIVSLACQILDVDASEEMKKINTIATMLRFLQNGESAQRGSANSKSFPDSVKMIGRHITIEDLDKVSSHPGLIIWPAMISISPHSVAQTSSLISKQ
ncbi:hypothetical protein DL93DRAFT_108600 [Clavulina sp. PMI_390]|nr:hypothetical protein DL93DRAFT_108600 [Clavulina sp. PMI_390]